MVARFVVGGPPNSGKSTFVMSLVRALQETGVDVYPFDQDIFSPTVDLIAGRTTPEERQSRKRKISGEEAVRLLNYVAESFRQLSEKHKVVIGDLPGRVSDDLKPVLKQATHAIIVCREDKEDEVQEWQGLFDSYQIKIVAIIISKTIGEETVSFSDRGPIRAVLTNLNRRTSSSPAIFQIAFLLNHLVE